jgi:acyl transferase domain-containing protein/NAD(P)-dependent dehydrogenase (short-subunit alcohol dehydrogenase family)
MKIAVIGMGCVFPRAQGLRDYWKNLRTGADAIVPVPGSHWNPDDYFDKDPSRPDMTYCRRGGFLDAFPFDPVEFGIPPTALEATDSSQLLGLVVAKQALEDAGYPPSKTTWSREKTSVILGVTGTLELVIPLGARLGHPHWRRALLDAGIPQAKADEICAKIADAYVPWQESSFPGLLGNVVAGRIANRFDLGGTNCVVDAACASSLSALHLAALELENRRADMVVTGGVDTFNDIFMYMCFSKTPALSPTGDAKPFDEAADGTILGEGIGMIVLKRLEDAERDGDRIYCVVRGIGSSSDGRSKSIYAPRSEGQAKALKKAYAAAEVSPSTIELVEAHGTGTKVGDVAEVDALKSVYREARPEGTWCALGSVKSQIGHTKAAAGAAGLIKAALALHHKVLPPTIKVKTPNPKLGLDDHPFYLSTETRPWLGSAEHPRRAGVSSFGFGGSNFHVVLEEHVSAKREPAWDGSVEVVAVSGPDVASLDAALAKAEKDPARARRAFSAQHAHRLVIVADDPASVPALVAKARERLAKDAGAWELPEGIYHGTGAAPGKLAFLFPGQGSQYVGMGRDVACVFPEALDAIRASGVGEKIFPRPVFGDAAKKEQQAELTRTDVAQPALGAVSEALLGVLERFGVKADATAGHSFGELVALRAAGRIDAAALRELATLRGRLMARCAQGSMLAVLASRDAVAKLVSEERLDLVVANRNAPSQHVLSGEKTEIEIALRACKTRGLEARELPVAAAFHSKLVAPAADPFRGELARFAFGAGAIPVYANVTAAPYDGDVARTLGEQLVSPVDFQGIVERLHADGVRTFVEVGPKAVLSGLVSATLGKGARAIALDASSGKRGLTDLARALGALAALGYAVALDRWDPRPDRAEEKPRMTVPISGANYRSPRTPKNGTAPAPKVAPAPRAVPPPAPIRVDVPVAPVAALASSPPPREAAGRSGGGTPPPSPEARGILTQALASAQDGIKAVQQLQEQTAALHKKFLESQEAAHRSYQALLENQQRIVERALGHAPASSNGMKPPAAVAVPAPVPVAVPAPVSVAAPAPVPAPVAPHPNPAPAALGEGVRAPAARGEGAELAKIIVAVVSEKTGYPADMVSLDMDLESDLGIDSIKRVEILSGVQERAPEMPTVEPENLGRLRTLRQIVELIESKAGAAAPKKPSTSTSTSASTTNLASVIVAVVSEKTGYPADMVSLDMDLESDLGIDSIKRVEILSGVQERAPEMPTVEPENLGRLRTLRQIVELIESKAGAPAAKKPSTSTSTTNLASVIVAVVSEKTGYPADMVSLDMDLESDLGIDSIKRVEILSGVQERAPDAPTVEPEQLGRLRTLRQIVDLIESKRGATNGAATHRPAPAAAAPVAVATVERSALALRALEEPSGTLAIASGHELWIVDDGALARPLTERLAAAGHRARVVPLAAASREAPVGGLVIIAPPRTSWNDESRDFLRSAFLLLKSVASDLRSAARKGGALVATVARLDGAFGLEAAGFDPLMGGLAGLAKTVASEWPEVKARAIDLSLGFPEADAPDALVRELGAGGPVEVALAPGLRRGLELVAAPIGQGPLPIRKGDVVLITGGARGVTAEVALALAQAAKPTLVLLGRSAEPGPEPTWLAGLESESDMKRAIAQELGRGATPATPRAVGDLYRKLSTEREVRKNLARMGEDARVLYRSVDIRDRAALAKVVAEARSLGPIRAVIHGAGVLEDRRIEEKTIEQFDSVFDTKVLGIRALLDATEKDDLAALILFSSVSGRFGRRGQIDYAMANEVLNKLAAVESRKRRGRVASLGWGPWEGGMVTPHLRREFEKEGTKLIPLDAGARACLAELSASGAVEVVLGSFPQAAAVAPAPARSTAKRGLDVVLERALTIEQNPILRSHVLGGRPVVPLALTMEWLGHAALHGSPGLQLHGFSDLRVLKALAVTGSERVRALAGPAEKKGDLYEVPVELRGENDAVHARARAVLVESLPPSPRLETPAVATRPYPRSIDEAYGSVLFHGPALRAIDEVVGLSSSGIVARVTAAPPPAQWLVEPPRTSWIADPLVLDACFQLAILWCHEEKGAPSLPVHVESYRQFRPFPRSGITATLIHRRSGPSSAVLDVVLAGPDGATLARIDGYECVMAESLVTAFGGAR